MLKLKNKVYSSDFRWLLLITVLIFVGILFYFEFVLDKSRFEIFHLYSFWGQQKLFDDLELLLCGIESMRHGINPYPVLCYPDAAPYNYPTTWRLFSYLPFFNNDNLLFIGWTFVSIFFVVFFIYIGKIRFNESLFYLLFLLSPPSAMLFCMGNSDLIIIDILLLGLVILPTYLVNIPIAFATILKIYPIGGILGVLNYQFQSKSKLFISLLVVIIPFGVYLIFWGYELVLIKQNTPESLINYSFGLSKLRINIGKFMELNNDLIYNVFFYAIFIIGFLLFYFFTNKKLNFLTIENGKYGNGYLISTGIYVLSYMMQINFEYRLFFLILSLPQLFLWIQQGYKFFYIILIMNILIIYDGTLTIFWNLFFDTRTAWFYLLFRGIRDIITLFLCYFYISNLIIYVLKNENLIQFQPKKTN